jgi:Domain of unknown function (DUF4388)
MDQVKKKSGKKSGLVIPLEDLRSSEPVDKEHYQLRPMGGRYFLLHIGSRFYENALDGKTLSLATDVEQFSVADFLLLIHQAKRSGIFVLTFGKFSKILYLSDGEIIMANSSLDDDRLGESLIRAGVLSQEQLDDCASEITPTNKLGKILVEKKLVTPKGLWHGVKTQITEIVYSLFSIDKGMALFFQGPVDLHNQVKLDKAMPDIVREGRRLFLDKQQIRAGFLEGDMVFKKGVAAYMSESMTAPEVEIFFMIDGFASVDDIISLSKFTPEEVWETFAGLLERSLVELVGRKEQVDDDSVAILNADPFADWRISSGAESDQQIEEQEVPSASVETAAETDIVPEIDLSGVNKDTAVSEVEDDPDKLFTKVYKVNNLLKMIAGVMKKRAPDENAIERFNSFFSDMPPHFATVFDSISLKRDGGIDYHTVIENSARIASADRGTVVLDAMVELLYFELFEMKNFIPKGEADELIARIKAMKLR